MSGERILVVDDEPGVRAALEAILCDEGFEVGTEESGEAGLEALRDQRYDAVMLDVWLPGIDGLETLKRLRERRFDVEVVMISGHGTIETAVRATKLGAFDFVEKPLSLEKTLLVLRNALRQRRLERMNHHLLQRLSRDTEIVGRSAAAETLRKQVDVAAESDSPVLIRGAQGSGRETVARRIHATGRTSDAAFVEVPCGALESAAAERALYGDEDQPGGRLRLAQGGTLFLEDVDRLAPELQRRLAASLQEQMKQPPGVRVIASCCAGNAELDPELKQRLDVIRIDVPPLRERREDDPLLAERFIRELSREYARETKRLSPGCLAALKGYDWPGNIRELHNLMERMLVLADGDVIEADDLPQELGGARSPAEDLYREFPSLTEGVQAFERYYILRILTEEGADRSAAARRLGISAAALDKRLARISPRGPN
jgi:two-component system nitrogen regulation response regulator NtrX